MLLSVRVARLTAEPLGGPLPTQISTGTRFSFSLWPAWKFWRHGSGVGRVVAADASASIVHVQILGVGPSVIAHLPILLSSVQPFARGIVPDPKVREDEVSQAAIEDWRREHIAGVAGVFSLPLHETVRSIYLTVLDIADRDFIESAYPVLGPNGKYQTIRVITSPAT